MRPASKAEQRRQCLAARRALPAGERALRSEQLCRRLLTLPEVRTARTVLSYLAARDEADLSSLHRILEGRGVRLCFPFVTGPGEMEALLPNPGSVLLPGPFGILAPDPAHSARIAAEELDLVLVPCVGFDRARIRLGHGGGYYDRYLLRCGQAAQICAALACQELPAAAREAHDLPLACVVTEEEILR